MRKQINELTRNLEAANSIIASSQRPPLAPATSTLSAFKNDTETVELASFLLDGDAEGESGPARGRSASSRGVASSPMAMSYRSDASADNPFLRNSSFEDEDEAKGAPIEADGPVAAEEGSPLVSPPGVEEEDAESAAASVEEQDPPQPKRLENVFEEADGRRLCRDIDNADVPFHLDPVLTPNECTTQDDTAEGGDGDLGEEPASRRGAGPLLPENIGPAESNAAVAATWSDDSAAVSQAWAGGAVDVTPENGTWRDVEGHASPMVSRGWPDTRGREVPLNKVIDEPPLRKSGFLLKRGFINTAFKLRWFVVNGCFLVFYKNISDVECRGSICCAGATVDRRHGDALNANTPFAFNLITPQDPHHGCWVLQATSEQERDEWLRVISAISALPLSSDSAVIRASSIRQGASPNTALAAGKAAGCIIS